MPADEFGVIPLHFCFSSDGTGKGGLPGSRRTVHGDVAFLLTDGVEDVFHGDPSFLPLEILEGVEGGILEPVEVCLGQLVFPLIEECFFGGLDVHILASVFEFPFQFIPILVGLGVLCLYEPGDGLTFKPPFLEGMLSLLGAIGKDPLGEDFDHFGIISSVFGRNVLHFSWHRVLRRS